MKKEARKKDAQHVRFKEKKSTKNLDATSKVCAKNDKEINIIKVMR